MVHVDHAVKPAITARWPWDGQPLEVQKVDSSLLTLADAAQLEHGHILTQYQVLSSPSQIHAALFEYWKSTWCNWADVDAPAWTRVQNFFTAYVPKIGFKLEPIDLDQWK